MGIGGHMLGPKKLRRLSRLSGLDLDRAYRRNRDAEGRVVAGGRCQHFQINPVTGEYYLILKPFHWTTCSEQGLYTPFQKED